MYDAAAQSTENSTYDPSSKCVPGQVRVRVGNDDPERRENVGRDQAEGDEPGASRFQVFELARGGHAHLEQEQAKHALEQRDEEVVVVPRDLLALQAADQPDDDAAKEQVQAPCSGTPRAGACR